MSDMSEVSEIIESIYQLVGITNRFCEPLWMVNWIIICSKLFVLWLFLRRSAN